MSGYEGEGTGIGGDDGPDGPDGANVGFGFEWGGPSVADNSIGAAAPNASMSLSDQLSSYGAGRVAGEVAGGYGAGRGAAGYTETAKEAATFLATGMTAAEQRAAAQPGFLETFGKTLLGLFGLASGTPQGVIGGSLSLKQTAERAGVSFGTSRASDLGFTGNLGSRSPELFAGSDGPPDTGFAGGAPVLGFGGSVVNNAPQTSYGSGVAPSLFPGLAAGYAPGGGLQYGAGFNTGAAPQPSAAPLLLLAGAASLFFMG